MAQTCYTYDLSDLGNPSGADFEVLAAEVRAQIPTLLWINSGISAPTALDLFFPDALSGPDQATLTATLAAHDGTVHVAVLEVSATDTIQTTSSKSTLMGGMVLTPGLGDFKVTFSADVEGSTKKGTVTAEYRVNGILVPGSSRSITTYGGSGYTMALQLQEVVSLGVLDVLEVYWSVNKGTGKAGNRTLLASSR